MSLIHSNCFFIYFLCFVTTTYTGYSEAENLSGSLLSITVGSVIGVIVGLSCFTIFKFTDDLIWSVAEKNEKNSFGAILGGLYIFLFCTSVIVFMATLTGEITIALLS